MNENSAHRVIYIAHRYTPGKVAELTACEFKEKTSHINCGTRAGLLQVNRLLVNEIEEVKVYIKAS